MPSAAVYGVGVYGRDTYGSAPAGGVFPTYLVEIAFVAPTAGLFALDIARFDIDTQLGTPYSSNIFQTIANVRSITIRRGRQDELGTIQAGTCDVLLDNNDGSLSPGNSASPYAPNVLPMRPIRVSAIWQGVTYRLFRGFIDSYTPVENSPVDADMKISAVDFFTVANRVELGTATVPQAFPAQGDADRVAAVLALLNTAGLNAHLDDNYVALVTSSLSEVTALQHLQEVATASRGLFYCRADGDLVYEGPFHRFLATTANMVQAMFGQPDPISGQYAESTLPFRDISYSMDTRYIYNDVRVNASGTAEGVQIAADPISQQVYFQSVLKIDSALLGPNQALPIAQGILATYKDAHPRLHSITIEGLADGTVHAPGDLWPALLSLDISSRIHVTKNKPGTLNLNGDFFIEGVQHDVLLDLGGHTVQYQLSDVALLGSNPWVLDSSQLDTGTVLGAV